MRIIKRKKNKLNICNRHSQDVSHLSSLLDLNLTRVCYKHQIEKLKTTQKIIANKQERNYKIKCAFTHLMYWLHISLEPGTFDGHKLWLIRNICTVISNWWQSLTSSEILWRQKQKEMVMITEQVDSPHSYSLSVSLYR
jgi:hypothetical protein